MDIITVIFEVLLLVLIIGTVREWQKSKRSRELLPIVAYLLAMISFLAPPQAGALDPWLVGLIWLGIGVVVRVIVRRRALT